MARYYVDTEHVRGEPRIYWVADRTQRDGNRISRGRPKTMATTDKRKAERDCARMNANEQQASKEG